MRSILIVEDHDGIGQQLLKSLRLEGYEPRLARSLAEARRALADRMADLVLLDVGLPDGDGIRFCAELREENPALPILLLTARTEEESVVRGFAAGAGDYLRKPFGYLELNARIKKLLEGRRGQLRAGSLTVNLDERKALHAGEPIALPPKEYALLVALLSHAGEVVAREVLVETVFPDEDVLDRTLDSHVSKLRAKLRKAGVTGVDIVPVYGVGYRLERE